MAARGCQVVCVKCVSKAPASVRSCFISDRCAYASHPTTTFLVFWSTCQDKWCLNREGDTDQLVDLVEGGLGDGMGFVAIDDHFAVPLP